MADDTDFNYGGWEQVNEGSILVNVENVIASVLFEDQKDDVAEYSLDSNMTFCLTFKGSVADGVGQGLRPIRGNIFFNDPEVTLKMVRACLNMLLSEKGVARMGEVFGEEVEKMVENGEEPYMMQQFIEDRMQTLMKEVGDASQDS